MFVTYENRVNPHTTVHRVECNRIPRQGGVRKIGQGGYRTHVTFAEADAYARSTELPVVYCALCHPEADQPVRGPKKK